MGAPKERKRNKGMCAHWKKDYPHVVPADSIKRQENIQSAGHNISSPRPIQSTAIGKKSKLLAVDWVMGLWKKNGRDVSYVQRQTNYLLNEWALDRTSLP